MKEIRQLTVEETHAVELVISYFSEMLLLSSISLK